MTSRSQSETGFTLIELLVAMSLMIVVLSATLTAFQSFIGAGDRNTKQNEQQDQARIGIDQLVRQLRNLASPTGGSTIAVAETNKLIFQTTDPSRQWVMYCLDTTNVPASTTRARLWYQTSTSNNLSAAQVAGTAASGNTNMSVGCPSSDSNWAGRTVVADYVTNLAPGTHNSLFTYYSVSGATSAPVALADTPTIIRVDTSLYVDLDLNKTPGETVISSGAYMRNQNQSPTAHFDAFPGSGQSYQIDGGNSTDPEGRTLRYDWYRESGVPTAVPASSALPDCSDTPTPAPLTFGGADWTCIGTGIILIYNFNGLSSPQNIWLRVTDPGNLSDLSDPSTGGTSCPIPSAPTRTDLNCESLSF